MKKITFLVGVLAALPILSRAETVLPLSTPPPKEETSLNLLWAETTYTFRSDFRHARLGEGDSVYTDFSYDRRLPITENWFFRAGLEYERYDFGGTNNGLPDHLQAISSHLAIDYVVRDFPGASLEIDPGIYFQDRVTGDAFDIPWKIYTTFVLRKDKIYSVIGLGGGIYQDPIVAPGGGVIWLISDKWRLQGVFPRPALIYDLSDDWQIRLNAELNYTSFRTDDVVTPLHKLQVHNAVLQYSENRAGAQVTYSGFKPFKVNLSAGYTIRRNFDFYRHDVSVRTDPAPYFRASIEAKF